MLQATLTGGPNGFINFLPQTIRWKNRWIHGTNTGSILPTQTLNVWYIYLHLTIFYGTLPETNIAPENRPSQKETSIPTIHFQVLC